MCCPFIPPSQPLLKTSNCLYKSLFYGGTRILFYVKRGVLRASAAYSDCIYWIPLAFSFFIQEQRAEVFFFLACVLFCRWSAGYGVWKRNTGKCYTEDASFKTFVLTPLLFIWASPCRHGSHYTVPKGKHLRVKLPTSCTDGLHSASHQTLNYLKLKLILIDFETYCLVTSCDIPWQPSSALFQVVTKFGAVNVTPSAPVFQPWIAS